MCGLIGTVDGNADAHPGQAVREGLRALAHRGPDASGQKTFTSESVGCELGAVRLRIIDLSPEADQPMSNEDGTVWVAYNGELYNHQELLRSLELAGHTFRSRTDTEVLVHLYEEHAADPKRMLEKLRGMFAFAIFDTKTGRLLLARDRLGIKPLYWTESGGRISFASEIRALARAGLSESDPNPDALLGYLLRGAVPGPASLFTGVNELPPGTFIEWSGGPAREERWWRPEILPDSSRANGFDEALSAVISDAVSRHLISDRPIGVFLSSGVDSGAVATVAARRGSGSLRTFTVTFPDASEDEGAQAAGLAKRIGASHEQVPITGAEVSEHLPEILQAMDQPTSDGVNTWLVCKAAKEAGLVVALSGLGGDELFGGYSSFDLVPKVARLRRLMAVVPRPMRLAAAKMAARRLPGGRLPRVLASEPGYAGAYAAVRGLFAPVELGETIPMNGAEPTDQDPRDAVTLLEATRYMPNQLLRDTDQMSMSHSLEVRVPLLDDEVVSLALSIPAAVRTEGGKSMLSRAAGLGQTPEKRPFSLPFDRWIAGPLRETVREGLLSESLPFADTVPAALRQRLWQTLGRTHWSRPWAVTVLRLWPEANGLRW
ncbi:MAG: asparagine synthase (glutamine-hydrolyzing) [Actinomycetota bacterium]